MRASCAVFLAAVIGLGFAPPRTHKSVPPRAHTSTHRLQCGDYLSFQVLLDRQGFSPGQIDGHPGDNFAHAIAAAQQARQVTVTSQADCDTWQALGGDAMEPPLTDYTITDADMKGPFEKRIPDDMMAQAKLPALSYQSAIEMLAERFHASPALLLSLNRRTAFASGRTIRVPAVTPFDPNARPKVASDADAVTITVSKEDSALHATKPDGSFVFFAPVTTGSEHDPLPIGNWKVTAVLWHPVFHYNPNLFWDAKAHDERTMIKPGPNNPVGVVWISLDLEHYGLHGTPEPSLVGHAASHGCVRLTNWDAVRVASLVTRGTPVVFQ